MLQICAESKVQRKCKQYKCIVGLCMCLVGCSSELIKLTEKEGNGGEWWHRILDSQDIVDDLLR
jgi:hypothetical protein